VCCCVVMQTLERSYLLKLEGRIIERPQHMLMRVSVGIHGEDVDAAIEVCNESVFFKFHLLEYIL